MTKKIAFFGTRSFEKDSFIEANPSDSFEIVFLEPRLTAETVNFAKGFDVVCVSANDSLTEAVIRQLKDYGIDLIALRCAGFNQVDVAALEKIGMPAVRVPAYSPHAVAEHTIALILAINRKIHRAYWRTRDHDFSLEGLQGFDMHGKTAGVIGAGQIGRIVAELLRAFGMEVLVFDVQKDPAWSKKTGCNYVDLPTLYQASHIITLNCPLTPETKKMINRESLQMMRPGVLLVNTGRGLLIDTQALIRALREKHVGGVALDVYEEEADLFFSDYSDTVIRDDTLALLLSFPNVLITGHQAFFTKEALHNIAHTTLENIQHFYDKTPQNLLVPYTI